MTSCLMTRTISGLAAEDEAASAVLRKIRVGDVVRVDVVRPRNLSAHRRWFALCNLIYETCEGYASPELVHAHLKILAGHATPLVDPTSGEMIALVPNSISFSSMGEDEFQEVWKRAVQAVCERILPTITVSDLENEILRLIGGFTREVSA